MDLDRFLRWLSDLLSLPEAAQPECNLLGEVVRDQFEIFTLVMAFDGLTKDDAAIDERIFMHVHTVRDLFLYYLTVTSMPLEES